MVTLDADHDRSEIFHIQFQTDGFSAAVCNDDTILPDDAYFHKIVDDGGNGGFVKTGDL